MFNKIGFKLSFAISLATIIIIVIFAIINIHFQREFLEEAAEVHANQLGETVKNSTRYDMLLNHQEHISKVISDIGLHSSIEEVRIFNKDGVIRYSSNSSLIGEMVDKKTEACFTCHSADEPIHKLEISERTRIFRIHPDSARVLGVINPIYNETSCWESACHAHPQSQTVLGILDVTVSLASIDEEIQLAKYQMIVFAVAAIILFSILLGYFVKFWIDKPVTALVKATEIVASGNLNYTIQEHGKDELGKLARSFNNMSKKLADARTQLLQSDRMASLGRLAAGVAHEINNPLTGILTYSSFLQKRTRGNSEIQEDLGVIVRETLRSREIVKSLLDFARQTVPKKRSTNINDIIDKALSVIENQLKIKGIKISKNLNQNLPNIVVDSSQIEQVFINLIDNAAYAIGDTGGTISLTTNLIRLEPYGITRIRNALCPKGHELMDNSLKIDGMPSIKIKARYKGNEGFINIHPIYGKKEDHYGIEIRDEGKMEIFCPKCELSLIDKNKSCPKCGSPVYSIEEASKGNIERCSNIQCGWQFWDTIEKEGKKEYIEIQLKDDGCGIDQENLYKIFDPFFTTKGQKGTGLGLAVVWGIIDNHQGRISVQSEVGIGTTFIIRFPRLKT
jgi:two-component system NtrC family sensor kinase